MALPKGAVGLSVVWNCGISSSYSLTFWLGPHAAFVVFLRRCFFYLLFVFVFAILPCLFLAALWSPVGKGLILLYVMFSCVFCHFPIWCPVSGVELDCIDSSYLHSFFLCERREMYLVCFYLCATYLSACFRYKKE